MSERSPDEPTIDPTVATDDADGRAYHVKLPMFEGPLDLLLHLIQKHELNILDIPIGFVALKYVEYIRMMEEMSIDIASEYLVMAATLAHIKSRSLLPPDPTQEAEEAAEEEDEDPRAELIRKLLEYQKYKHAADTLGQREVLGRDVFQRGLAQEQTDEEAPLAPMSLFKLVDAFESVLKRAKQVQEHQIDFEKVSISDRIGQIVERMRSARSLQFEQLFEGDVTRAEMIVTFLALLEMTKLRMTRLTQEGPLAPIVVELLLSAEQAKDFDTQRAFEQMQTTIEHDFAPDKPEVAGPAEPSAATPAWEEIVDDLELNDEELADELREAAQAFGFTDSPPNIEGATDPEAGLGDEWLTFGAPDEQWPSQDGSALDGGVASEAEGRAELATLTGSVAGHPGAELERASDLDQADGEAVVGPAVLLASLESESRLGETESTSALEGSVELPERSEPEASEATAPAQADVHEVPLGLVATELSASVPEPETEGAAVPPQEGSQDPSGSDVEKP